MDNPNTWPQSIRIGDERFHATSLADAVLEVMAAQHGAPAQVPDGRVGTYRITGAGSVWLDDDATVIYGADLLESDEASELLETLAYLLHGSGTVIRVEAPCEEDNGGMWGVWLDDDLVGTAGSASDALQETVLAVRDWGRVGGFK